MTSVRLAGNPVETTGYLRYDVSRVMVRWTFWVWLKLIHTHIRLCPDHVVSLKINTVSFLFESHSETAFDAQMLGRAPAVLRPSTMKAISQGHDKTRSGHSTACVKWNTSVLRRPVGDEQEDPRFDFFRLPHGPTRRLLPQCLSVTKWIAANIWQN